jgi:hypothetical protein
MARLAGRPGTVLAGRALASREQVPQEFRGDSPQQDFAATQNARETNIGAEWFIVQPCCCREGSADE